MGNQHEPLSEFHPNDHGLVGTQLGIRQRHYQDRTGKTVRAEDINA